MVIVDSLKKLVSKSGLTLSELGCLIIFTTALIVLSGCTTAASVRVIEYGGGGAAGMFTGAVGGCTVNQQKGSKVFADVAMTYVGKNCSVVVEVKSDK